MSESPRVSVVIPALNEERNIPHVFARIPQNTHEVILVDGIPIDGTVGAPRKNRPNVCVVSQGRKGKGNALACGFEAATGDVIAMIDGDGSADLTGIPRFVAALVEGADFAMGTRFLPGGGSVDITRLRRLGNYSQESAPFTKVRLGKDRRAFKIGTVTASEGGNHA